MKNKMKILVTGVGSNIGQGIIKALRLSGKDYYIIGTDMKPFSSGLFRCNKGYVIPPANNPGFIGKMKYICETESVDVILVGSNQELPVFSKHKEMLYKTCGTIVIASPIDVVNITHDKWSTYKFLKEQGLNYPETALGNDDEAVNALVQKTGFPLIVKPRTMEGSRYVHIVHDHEELHFFLKRTPEPIVQEYLGNENEEYTCGTFCSGSGEVLGAIVMSRKLFAGTTIVAKAEHNVQVEEEARKVAGKLGAHGPCNVQMRMSPRGPVTFEINLRFSGTTFIKAVFGFNEPVAALDHFLFRTEPVFSPKTGTALRYWNELFISDEVMTRLEEDGSVASPHAQIYNFF